MFLQGTDNLKKITLISLVFYIVASIFSSGFHHFDEHFQINEFLNFKLGGITGSELAWEYREKIRPWFQVFVYHKIYFVFDLLGMTSPFSFHFLFRLFSSLFGLYSIYFFYPVLKNWFKNDTYSEWAYGLMLLSWFSPYILTRTSSESFGISFFLLATSLFLRLKELKRPLFYALLAGLFFGLSYQSRFQMAAMVAPLWFHSLFFNRNFKELSLVAVGVLLGIGSGFLFDYWGYGVWNFSLWHYFRTNFLEGIMSNVQQYPFWWYVRLCFNRGIPPVSLVLILATFFGWWKYRKHPLTWMTLPLFLFHSWVGHKELRYLFPIIILSPIYLLLAIQELKLVENKYFRPLAKFVLTINVIVLIIACLRPANPAVNFYKFMWKQDKINKIYAHNEDPFSMLGLPIRFFKRKELAVEVFKGNPKDQIEPGKYIFLRKGRDLMEFEKNKDCELLYLTYPRFSLNFNIGNWLSRSRVWSLFKCN